MWVDETGRARTVSGGFADGLTKIQLELGQYADELGNVRDQYGQIIGKTKEALKAEEALNVAEAKRADEQKKELNAYAFPKKFSRVVRHNEKYRNYNWFLHGKLNVDSSNVTV